MSIRMTETTHSIVHGDVSDFYAVWDAPKLIVSDGAYGLASFPGEPDTLGRMSKRGYNDVLSLKDLSDWYAPHIRWWTAKALPSTTLCFWNSELGWATVHPKLVEAGWVYKQCITWDKGMSHVAGNCNTQTLRMFPVVTEVCVIYVRKEPTIEGLSLQQWLRSEWVRTKLTSQKANDSCGVKHAASRKYLTTDKQWYFPPPEQFSKLCKVANEQGVPTGRPYFSLDGKTPMTEKEWDAMRAPFQCPVGLTNVWNAPAPKGKLRTHMNQKPIQFMERLVTATTRPGDVVWEPFGGSCPVSQACRSLGRSSYAAELDWGFFELARARNEDSGGSRDQRHPNIGLDLAYPVQV